MVIVVVLKILARSYKHKDTLLENTLLVLFGNSLKKKQTLNFWLKCALTAITKIQWV